MERPNINHYQAMDEFLRDMLKYRKKSESGFSVYGFAKTLRRVSPSLVTLILKGQRHLTLDRADELAALMGLTPGEKAIFKRLVAAQDLARSGKSGVFASITSPEESQSQSSGRRKMATAHLLSDWVNPYVKDSFQLKEVQRNPKSLYWLLSGIASRLRIDRSLRFLLHAGYLRRRIDGRITVETPLHAVDQKIPSSKVRQFHKGALKVAASALDNHPVTKRYANTAIIPLNERRYAELCELIADFSERVQRLAEDTSNSETLYQLIINLSPTGSYHDKSH